MATNLSQGTYTPLHNDPNDDRAESSSTVRHCEAGVVWRDVIAFWIFGLCNNYPYVIMLSAATYILEKEEGTSTGVILLADILPTLTIKLSAPFFMHLLPYSLKVGVVIATCYMSFILVAYSSPLLLSVLGVCLASFSSGFGEITYLSLTHHYDKSTVSAWSSGTGMAGAAGSLSYLALTLVMQPREALLVMVIVPLIMTITYLYMLRPLEHGDPKAAPTLYESQTRHAHSRRGEVNDQSDQHTLIENDSTDVQGAREAPAMTMNDRIRLIKPLLRWMIPLFLVYYAEYLINQGLLEHVWWNGMSLTKQHQYVLFQAMYQMGVFISRSSVPWITIERTWILAVLQIVNFGLLLLDNIYHFVPHISLYCLWIFYEGLLGGSAYVNSFYSITNTIDPLYREFALGITSVADTFGITCAALSSIALNHWLGPLAAPRRR
ncbi:hypothetical protein SARC_00720 [Sphaeroforma arctica JP610]|uniref:Battenin n=1 Tax=Sphaeroforma arctica JP610 TaxID=667725 RepID=A0A0L0GDQ5_9EUKA|nr:hypothetical protein SARC_00720 [Sphaeroforma arctica JP610]KNC87137.1 hypothetical protein SARC_00720 [Sphaeroforma arctica JP610]|eukprot:XP_014161039.1 hypothetical protein SARC_00720 [Sphaeroforma arctica JP610]